ncbi:MAG TPA: CoA pyrophosphatase [Gammaproteobacteria bacterium]|nr:CoA pyrophosphatase [Gammaproteobacteria bacterium]
MTSAMEAGADWPVWIERLARSLDKNDDSVHLPTLDMLRASGRWTEATQPLDAAVLVPILEAAGGPELILTRRRDDLDRHAGQVAFPGGARDPDDRGPEGTALREAEEEIALPAGNVGVLGRLPRYPTVSGYLVTPVVGYIAHPVKLHAAPGEVAEIFTLPLSVLLDRSRWIRRSLDMGDRRVSMREMHWGDQRIWGVTAGMLQIMIPMLREALEADR